MSKAGLPSAWRILPCMLLIGAGLHAQSDGWKTAALDGGKITVEYRISERVDDSGARVPLIEDRSTTTESVSLKSCVALMKDVARHKDFMGDYSSEKLRETAENAWLVYYYSKNPWPVADSDCVAVMTFDESASEGRATFTLSAAPSMLEARKVKRMSYYAVSYSFKDLGDGRVEMTVTGRTSPPVEVPLWLIRSAFPGAPADAVRKFMKIAKGK
jgi:hypothetical protein